MKLRFFLVMLAGNAVCFGIGVWLTLRVVRCVP